MDPHELKRAAHLLQQNRVQEAAALCDAALARDAGDLNALLLSARVRQREQRFEDMLALTDRAVFVRPADARVEFLFIEALILCGRIADAVDRLHRLESEAGADTQLCAQLAQLYTQVARHSDAVRCYRRMLGRTPGDPQLLYNLAASLIAVGELDEAEALFDRVIELAPDDFAAWYNRSTLRTQSATRNNVDALRQRLAALRNPSGEIPLGYALAKELEDLGDYAESFKYLTLAARRRKLQLSYRVAEDVATIDHIIRVFDAAYFARSSQGYESARSIFVLGLPRSGTTLVDRILSSHTEVKSLGEIRDFALALIRLTHGAANRLALVEKTAGLDPAALGLAYDQSIVGYGASASRLIDKTPLNFLYLGLIHSALPNARVLHLRRHPMDSCFAMYKTLFQAGYPFSYDLDDLAEYYIAYDRLMAHWRAIIPQAFLDVDYEALVVDQEPQTRRMLEYCGLQWQDACLEFHRNASPAATASAAQVRQPIYTKAVQRWRKYEQQLHPLAQRLRAAGIAVD